MIRNLLIVGAGGAIGTVLRYLIQRWTDQQIVAPFPWGTFLVNIAGCLLIGLFWGLSLRQPFFTAHWKLFLMRGICGGFTTFSAFTLDGNGLLRENKIGLFFLYTGLSVILGLTATWIGIKLTRI